MDIVSHKIQKSESSIEFRINSKLPCIARGIIDIEFKSEIDRIKHLFSDHEKNISSNLQIALNTHKMNLQEFSNNVLCEQITSISDSNFVIKTLTDCLIKKQDNEIKQYIQRIEYLEKFNLKISNTVFILTGITILNFILVLSSK